MISRIWNTFRRCFTSMPEPDLASPPPTRIEMLRDEYEAIPKGPKGVRRKRNSVKSLAAKHRMSTAELMAAVRRQQ